MKLLSFTYENKIYWGAVYGDTVIDMAPLTGCDTLAQFIASPGFARRNELVAGVQGTIPLASITWLPVILQPEKIILLVRNYLDHHHEVVAAGLPNREIPKFPPLFLRVWRSLAGHDEPIIRPRVSHSLDWEGELAVVIGKPGRHIRADQALSHIAGYTCFNDASIREWQFHAQQIAAGKNFEKTGPMGPWMVTADEIADPGKLEVTVRINGVVEQHSNTSNLIHGIERLIEYCSDIFELVPGDIIVTGTPGGVGWGRKPPKFLVPGDVVEVDIERVGVLRNTVADEAAL